MFFRNLEKTITSKIPNSIKTTVRIISGEETKKKLTLEFVEDLSLGVFRSCNRLNHMEAKKLWQQLDERIKDEWRVTANVILFNTDTLNKNKEILDRNPYATFLILLVAIVSFHFFRSLTFVQELTCLTILFILGLACYFDFKRKKKLYEME